MSEIDIERVPRHVAIIMDGNGRWATNRGLSRFEGHVEGYKNLKSILQVCSDMGVKVLTVYAFSTENWRRPKDEVDALMRLFMDAARREMGDMLAQGVRMVVSGRIEELPDDTRQALESDIEATQGNTKITLNLAINYGGRREIIDAARKIALGVAEGQIDPESIDEQVFGENLYSPGLPDPDLLIRTAGEMRVSNFLLWEIAYAEIYVTQTLWPDFTKDGLMLAIADYQRRTRKFGTVVNEKSG